MGDVGGMEGNIVTLCAGCRTRLESASVTELEELNAAWHRSSRWQRRVNDVIYVGGGPRDQWLPYPRHLPWVCHLGTWVNRMPRGVHSSIPETGREGTLLNIRDRPIVTRETRRGTMATAATASTPMARTARSRRPPAWARLPCTKLSLCGAASPPPPSRGASSPTESLGWALTIAANDASSRIPSRTARSLSLQDPSRRLQTKAVPQTRAVLGLRCSARRR